MRARTPSPAEAAPPSRRFTDSVQGHVTVVRQGLRVKGELAGAEALEIAGRFDGPLSINGLCHLHESARVVGAVTAGDAVIEGELQGSLTVRGRVELRPTARVRGPIRAESVALAEGCFFEGHIHMEADSETAGPTSFQEKRKSR